MVQPYNYMINTPDPTQSVMGGLQAGLQIGNLMTQAQAHQLATQKAQLALERQQAMQKDLAALHDNPSTDAIVKFTAAYPEASEGMKRLYDMASPEEKRQRIANSSQAFSAILNNKPEIAAQTLRDQAAAYRNAGDEANAVATEKLADVALKTPSALVTTGALNLASAMGPGEFQQTFGALMDQYRKSQLAPAEQQKAEAEAKILGVKATAAPYETQLGLKKAAAEIANLGSQVQERADRLGLDKDKLLSDVQQRQQEFTSKLGQLPESTVKLVNESSGKSLAADQLSSRFEGLASQMEGADVSEGWKGRFAETAKKVFGSEDANTLLKNEFARLKNNIAIKSLPQGSASDADIEMAKAGMPSDNADSKTIAQFLRGMAKMSRLESATENATANWLAENGTLTKSKKDMEIDGVKVPAGTQYADFVKKYAPMKERELAKEAKDAAKSSQTNQAGYMKYASGTY